MSPNTKDEDGKCAVDVEDNVDDKPKTVGLMDLPDNVLLKILGYLTDVKDVWKGPRGVCHKLGKLCLDPEGWKAVQINTGSKHRDEVCLFTLQTFPPLLSQTKNLEMTGCIWGAMNCGAMERLSRGLISNAKCLRILTISQSNPITHVTVFDFPATLEHLHLDCNVPDYFFVPFAYQKARERFTSLKCIRLRITDEKADGKLLTDFAAFPGTLSSLSIDCHANHVASVEKVLQSVGNTLSHLSLKYFGSTANSRDFYPLKLGQMVSQNCPKLVSLTHCVENVSPFAYDDSFIRHLSMQFSDVSGLQNNLEHLVLSSDGPFRFDPKLIGLELMKKLKTIDLCYDTGKVNLPKGMRPLLRFCLPDVTLRFFKQINGTVTTYPERSGLEPLSACC